jgi:uncharacterized protein (DUF58 family)
MSRTPKLALYASLAASSFLIALVLGRPELAALGAPFAFVLLVGLSLPPPEEVAARLEIVEERAVEHDEIAARLVLGPPERNLHAQVRLRLPDGIRLADGETSPLLKLSPGEKRALPLRLVPTRWGAYRLGDMAVRGFDRAGLRSLDQALTGEAVLRVYPGGEHLRSLVAPMQTQPFAGNRVARAKGEGIEFADIRPYAPGDRPRRINWRASAIRQTLYVNQQHPERNSDVVIFLDTFDDVRRGGRSTLDQAVRAAASLADDYLRSRDRVGLVSFGGTVRWLTPAASNTQLYRIVDALLETEIFFSFAWKDIHSLPARSLTPQALVIALSPLLDDRSIGALLDLRNRGFDLVVVDVSPLAVFEERNDAHARLGLRLWRLRREAIRFRYERLGVAVVEWEAGTPLQAAIEEVRSFRRFARYASA